MSRRFTRTEPSADERTKEQLYKLQNTNDRLNQDYKKALADNKQLSSIVLRLREDKTKEYLREHHCLFFSLTVTPANLILL